MTLLDKFAMTFSGKKRAIKETPESPFFELQTKPTDEQAVIMDQSDDVEYLIGIIQQKNALLEEMREENLNLARENRRLYDEIYRLSGQNSAYKEHLSNKAGMVVIKGV